MTNKLSEEETNQILLFLKEGKSQNEAARLFRRSPGTINKIAQRNGIKPLDVHAQKTEAATKARRYYAKEGRLDLLESEFDKIKELLPEVEKASQIRELALATAILCDKYRLEEGQATSRSEILGQQGISDAKAQLRELLHIDENNQPLESDDDTNTDTN